MSVSLQKGQRVSLVKDNNPVKNLVVGLGWDMNKLGKKNYDLDAFAIALTNQDKMNVRGDLVYFGNLKHPSKTILCTYSGMSSKLTIICSSSPSPFPVKLSPVCIIALEGCLRFPK